MKIKHKSPDLLIAGETPWVTATLLYLLVMLFALNGLLFMPHGSDIALVMILGGGGMGIIAVCLFVERLQMVLDAQTRTVTISCHTIFNYSWAVYALDDLLYAAAETPKHASLTNIDEIRRSVSRPSLVLRDGSNAMGLLIHPVSDIYAKGRYAANVVGDINNWLKDLRGRDVLPKSA
jgi:hypothetical protein